MRIKILLQKSKYLLMIFLTLGINCSNISANTLNNAEYSDLEKRINLKFNDYILGPGD